MPPVSLRDASPDDAEGLGAMHVAAWRETYAGLVPDGMLAGLSAEGRAANWARMLRDPSAFDGTAVRIAEEDGRILGFGATCRQRDQGLREAGFDAEISAIYLLRSHQGLGLGRALMRDMASALRRHGHAAASLWVLRGNAAARGFYTHLGGELLPAEKVDERPEATLVEVAYGWRDLALLAAGPA